MQNSKGIILIAIILISLAGAYMLLKDTNQEVDEPALVATFNVSNLEIEPIECYHGKSVDIKTYVENSGNKTGSYEVILLIDGEVEQTQEVELSPDENTTIKFTTTKEKSKEYFVEIDDLSGTFTILEPAKFKTSNFLLHPHKCGPNKNVTVRINVENIGQSPGNYTLELKVDAITEKIRTVYLEPDEAVTLNFTLKKTNMKFYLVEIEDYAGRFEVVSYNMIKGWGGQGDGGGLFNYPTGIAVDEDGYVYVTDTLNHRVQKFTSEGEYVTMWGEEGHGAGQFSACLDIDVDSDGYVYVAGGNSIYAQKFTSEGSFVTRWNAQGGRGIAVGDNGLLYITAENSVRVFNSDGEFIEKWGSEGGGDGEFTKASGIDIDEKYVYVAELDREGNHRVQKFTLRGDFVSKWNLPEPCCSWWPLVVGISVDGIGNVYVSNPYESSITKFDPDGNVVEMINDAGDGFNEISQPQGICHNKEGDIYLSDRGNYRVKKLDGNLETITFWGGFGGSGSGYFSMPLDCDIYEDEEGQYIFVNEFWNCRVQKFDLNGCLVSLWGTMGRGSGQFRYPEAIAVDKNGFLYVSDSGNNRVQKFDSDGNFITEWGSHGSGNGEFKRNVGIATDPEGEFVYVVGMGNQRVQKFTSEGLYVNQWRTEIPDSSQFSPRGIEVDMEEYVYVSEEGPHMEQSRVQKFTMDGELVDFWYMEAGGSTGTPRLYDIALDKTDGNIYVCNKRVGEINKFTPDGGLIHKWSIGGNGIAVDSDGILYVVDPEDHKLYKIKLYW
jgi:DNA-binding beta-propeller fold protein YncE